MIIPIYNRFHYLLRSLLPPSDTTQHPGRVSVIIPSYNRFHYLLNAIKSVQEQTYSDVEIIVINDCSTQKEYYRHDFGEVKIIHLKKNSKKLFGFSCPGGYQRNFGFAPATGEYIAFLDDDDVWLPDKLKLQIRAMKKFGCEMSCTEGLIGEGVYRLDKNYPKYNAETWLNTITKIFKNKNSSLLDQGFPDIWNLNFLKIHNCCICSSVVIKKSIIKKAGYFGLKKTGDDYLYWLKILKYTDCVYVKEPCIYYDNAHGDGQLY